jgi:hypothetical protein
MAFVKQSVTAVASSKCTIEDMYIVITRSTVPQSQKIELLDYLRDHDYTTACQAANILCNYNVSSTQLYALLIETAEDILKSERFDGNLPSKLTLLGSKFSQYLRGTLFLQLRLRFKPNAVHALNHLTNKDSGLIPINSVEDLKLSLVREQGRWTNPERRTFTVHTTYGFKHERFLCMLINSLESIEIRSQHISFGA